MKARDVSVWVKVGASLFMGAAAIAKLILDPRSLDAPGIALIGLALVAVWMDVAVNLAIEKIVGRRA